MVIAVILILAGITFGISRGVQNAQARAKAKAELATISQALETYKSKNGDYPWNSDEPEPNVADDNFVINSSHGLLKTLVGWQSFDGTQVGNTDSNDVVFTKGDSVLDVSKLSLSLDWPDSNPEESPSLVTYFKDPWGNPYVYLYKNSSSSGRWDRFGYVLFSRGADGIASSTGITETTGEIVTSPEGSAFKNQNDNIDNIYAGE